MSRGSHWPQVRSVGTTHRVSQKGDDNVMGKPFQPDALLVHKEAFYESATFLLVRSARHIPLLYLLCQDGR